mmetsp:Transcript_27049/g.85613  ORF Transcript_27049/g.85613 Transcript_27049/m.85613 type:complete len:234 (-) Transcript_27049:445-1146(-)
MLLLMLRRSAFAPSCVPTLDDQPPQLGHLLPQGPDFGREQVLSCGRPRVPHLLLWTLLLAVARAALAGAAVVSAAFAAAAAAAAVTELANNERADETRHRAEDGHAAKHEEESHHSAPVRDRRHVAVPDSGHCGGRPPQRVAGSSDARSGCLCLEEEHGEGSQHPSREREETRDGRHRQRPRLREDQPSDLNGFHNSHGLEETEAPGGAQRAPHVPSSTDGQGRHPTGRDARG